MLYHVIYTQPWYKSIDLESGKNCILLFADDIVILAEDEIKLQILLDFTNK